VLLDLRACSFDFRRALFDRTLSRGLSLFILCGRSERNKAKGISERTSPSPRPAVAMLTPFFQSDGLLLLHSLVFDCIFSRSFRILKYIGRGIG
jgi:hypothetical protein